MTEEQDYTSQVVVKEIPPFKMTVLPKCPFVIKYDSVYFLVADEGNRRYKFVHMVGSFSGLLSNNSHSAQELLDKINSGVYIIKKSKFVID